MFTNQYIKHNIRMMLSIVMTLLLLGVVFVYSASSFFAFEMHGIPFYFVYKQLFGIMLGLCALLLIYNIPLSFFKESSFILLCIALLLTILTLTPLGYKIYGAQRWLKIPFIMFQPSELLKITLIIHFASFLSRKKISEKNLFELIPFGIVTCICILVLLKQPDFGCAVTILLTLSSMLFIAHFPLKYVCYMIGITIPTLFALIYMQPYRWQRIITFLNPWNDPQGAGFQIIQALIAEGSGGLWGTGISQSKQKFLYLPMQHTDFIFAIIAEETGFIGSCFLTLLYVLLLWFGFSTAWKVKNLFSAFLIQGCTIMLSLQTLINLYVATGLAPTKGIGLPFLSYGNSALISHIIMIGLMVNAALDEV